eukprot:CAMPEP_0118650720 /NCGR_PEP_ID=MMETSP0785-20121206/10395_1 /TAXON_ID=91992 /ORGANISM="Bolidomonas pacifica, Strain CCMP 1866" /LENGTH=136 /DNA_ID=CAMNT_0006543109 /DNA_START=265 /DNA_END=672 /DNA_ORIENTATION=+
MPISVPLWLAVMLRRTNRCRIVPPQWMNVDYLTSVREYEKDPANEGFFTSAPNPHDPDGPEIELPYHYQEIASTVMEVASEDLNNPKTLPSLLSDIECLRASKSSNVLKRLSSTLGDAGAEWDETAPDVVYNMQSG